MCPLCVCVCVCLFMYYMCVYVCVCACVCLCVYVHVPVYALYVCVCVYMKQNAGMRANSTIAAYAATGRKRPGGFCPGAQDHTPQTSGEN